MQMQLSKTVTNTNRWSYLLGSMTNDDKMILSLRWHDEGWWQAILSLRWELQIQVTEGCRWTWETLRLFSGWDQDRPRLSKITLNIPWCAHTLRWFTAHTVHFAPGRVIHSTLCVHTCICTCILHYAPCTMHLYTMHYALHLHLAHALCTCTMHYVLCTMHCTCTSHMH